MDLSMEFVYSFFLLMYCSHLLTLDIFQYTVFGSISVSGQLPTYPSPSPTLTLTCCQLTVVELGEG